MPTKKQLEDEMADLRRQLYQERQDHGNYVRHLKETAYQMARESMRVKMVLAERAGYYGALPIVLVEEGHDGVNVVVANARVQAGTTAPQPDPERGEAARRGASPGTKC